MVRDLAAYADTPHLALIRVTGHMDTAEAREFSDELGMRRAQAVATELVRLGIDPAYIDVVGEGANRLARPTPADTREPLNRRAVVGVSFRHP